MWRWLLILSLSVKAFAGVPSVGTSNGPTSPEEADFLWIQGREEMASAKFADASFHLDRFIDRYPGHQGYLQAHFLMGQAQIQLSQPEKALKPLKYFINSAGKTQPAILARLWLGRAYLDLEKFHEALLTSKEVEKAKLPLDHSVQADALIIKARALIGLNQDDAAKKALDSAKKQIDDASSALMASAHWTELKLKTRSCSRLGTRGPLDESQLRDQLQRRGTCLLEALVLFKKTLDIQDPLWAERARADTWSAFEGYSVACEKPLIPNATKPRNRTQTQLKKYRQELTAILAQDCHVRYESALELLNGWKTGFSPKIAEPLAKLTHSVEELSKKKYNE